ncbi:MAG: NTP transferase domain-containing protein, partial [Campylobacterales bacterium]|nr:NTP transferase domain-containing protein [Campylobacterales bacterium]
MKAVVMAGGFGTRIQPLTSSLPKPMLPVINKPMMQHVIERLRDQLGITDFVILLYFKPEIIKDYFKDGKEFGINIQYVLPDDDYGTAGAVKCAQKYLDDRFIVVSGDLVTDFDFTNIVKYHEDKESQLTITLTSVDNPLQFGVVITDQNGKIQKFLEKPSWGEVFSDTINTGIYLIEPNILNYIPEDENYDFAKDLFPKLMKENITLWGYNANGYWRDVGNPESYREVHQDILDLKVDIKFPGKFVQIDGAKIYLEDENTSLDGVNLKGVVVLGKNVKLSPDVELRNVILGDNTVVDEKTKISDCTIWNDVLIDSKTKLSNCVICNNNKIGKKVKAKDGLILAENCEIDRLVSFEKDVIVWPDKVVEEASIVSNNIIWGSKYKNSIFEAGSVIGRTNIELSCEMSTKLAESFGSILPKGSLVYVSRDYHKSSRMLKRAFLGGLLSTGINVVDIHTMPSNVMRYNLSNDENAVAGIHFRQSVEDQTNTEIVFFTQDALTIDTNTAKNVERIFFRENFRRVNFNDIGQIVSAEDNAFINSYKAGIIKKLNCDIIKKSEIKL